MKERKRKKIEGGVAVFDFGGQYSQLIARKVREAGVYSELIPFDIPAPELAAYAPGGIILSGGPSSIYRDGAPRPDPGIYDLGIPILGICYGLHLLTERFGGRVAAAASREYGPARIKIENDTGLFSSLGSEQMVWMSHGDHVAEPPPGFRVTGRSDRAVAAMTSEDNLFTGLQFHPEVFHTPEGPRIFSNFLENICGLKRDWSMASFLDRTIGEIRERVGDGRVLCALSGGVDSTVVCVLLARAVGNRVFPVFVDNGVVRRGETSWVIDYLGSDLGIDVRLVRAENLFMKRLAGVTDPERKRKIIGNTFIEVFEKEASRLENIAFLAQGTLYPDVIESVSNRGPSATIKSHHNVGGLPERMKLALIEPLRELFKDEVRQLGRELGIPEPFVERQPFPGPGLAVRILGEVTRERCEVLREADEILLDIMKREGLYTTLWQTFAVLVPVKTVGVMGDERTYENLIAIRAVESVDGMTARIADLPRELLEEISGEIISRVRGVNRVVYDVSSKPPSTIEWE